MNEKLQEKLKVAARAEFLPQLRRMAEITRLDAEIEGLQAQVERKIREVDQKREDAELHFEALYELTSMSGMAFGACGSLGGFLALYRVNLKDEQDLQKESYTLFRQMASLHKLRESDGSKASSSSGETTQ